MHLLVQVFSQQMQMMVRSLHADTHFSLQGQDDRCKTRLGTRPGDSWADIIFSFLVGSSST